MNATFRDYIELLRDHDELLDIRKPVDLRDVAALTAQSDRALLFENPVGYSFPVASGLLQKRERLGLALDAPYPEIHKRFQWAMSNSIEPVLVEDAPVKEFVQQGGDVDLFQLPVPIFSTLDGAPMITAAVVISEDPEHGMNAGVYRLMLKERNVTGIDIVTPNNLRRFAERALAEKRPLPISMSIGAHPRELMGALFKASLGTNELGFAGALGGSPVELTPGVTGPVPSIAGAEFVLEGEIPPEGWVHPEGPFGEFSRLVGGTHRNPNVHVKAVLHRRDPLYYALHMPWENLWMSAPIYEAAAWRVLAETGVQVTAVNVTPGGCCHWHVVAAIRKIPGDGKNAIAALLSIADIKYAVVTDDDIDIYDPQEVEWAIATRVQADRDTVILSHARSKPLDPSIPPSSNGVPTTAKMGIDATIPENVPRYRYNRIVYHNQDKARLEDYLGEAPVTPLAGAVEESVEALTERAEAMLRDRRMTFSELLDAFPDAPFASVMAAVGQLNERKRITLDEEGKYMPAAESRPE